MFYIGSETSNKLIPPTPSRVTKGLATPLNRVAPEPREPRSVEIQGRHWKRCSMIISDNLHVFAVLSIFGSHSHVCINPSALDGYCSQH